MYICHWLPANKVSTADYTVEIGISKPWKTRQGECFFPASCGLQVYFAFTTFFFFEIRFPTRELPVLKNPVFRTDWLNDDKTIVIGTRH